MFGVGVQVESQRIRSSAQKMKQFASDAKGLPRKVVGDAERAENANKGFMCADGAKDFVDDFEQDMDDLRAHLEDTSEVLGDIADHWDQADEEGAADFKPIESDLSGFKVPKISGGA